MSSTKSPRQMKFNKQGYVKCRVCSCTEYEPCNPPCSWAEPDLCSSCEEAVNGMYDWFHAAHRPNLTGLLAEYKRQVRDTPVPYTLTTAETDAELRTLVSQAGASVIDECHRILGKRGGSCSCDEKGYCPKCASKKLRAAISEDLVKRAILDPATPAAIAAEKRLADV